MLPFRLNKIRPELPSFLWRDGPKSAKLTVKLKDRSKYTLQKKPCKIAEIVPVYSMSRPATPMP